MNDPDTPNSGNETGPRSPKELTGLTWWVEGLADADRLLAKDANALLHALAAMRGAMEGGEVQAARRHLQQFCRRITALVHRGMLEEAPGRAALEAARHLFTERNE